MSSSLKSTDDHRETVLRLIRERSATTRPELVLLSGLTRKIVLQRVEQLIDVGLVKEDSVAASTGGRPAGRLRFAADAGCILTAVLGGTGFTVAIADLAGTPFRQHASPLPYALPAEQTLPRVEAAFHELLTDPGIERGPLRGIGVGVLGPVSPTGLTMDVMPKGGWEGFSVSQWFGKRHGVPVWVDNEVNMMALGEAHRRGSQSGHSVLYVKVSTGIGAGLISDRRLYRGATGVAGELAHVTVPGARSLTCWCGNSGCLSTLASGPAIAQFGEVSKQQGQSPYLENIPLVRDRHVVAGAHAGDPACLQIMQRAGEALGLAVASATNLFNPGVIVIGGRVGGLASHLFVDPVRAAVQAHTFRLASQHIVIESSVDAHTAGVVGTAQMVIQGALSGDHLAAWDRLPRPAAAATTLTSDILG
ncbi:MAG: ROK family protein [Arachnia sp.]